MIRSVALALDIPPRDWSAWTLRDLDALAQTRMRQQSGSDGAVADPEGYAEDQRQARSEWQAYLANMEAGDTA